MRPSILCFAIAFVFLSSLTEFALANEPASSSPENLQIINVLKPEPGDLEIPLNTPIILKFNKMGGRIVSVSATHYPILVKLIEIPRDAYVSHYFMCSAQTMANDPENSVIWLASADPAAQLTATHTWLQLNRKGEVKVTFVVPNLPPGRNGHSYDLPGEEAGRIYLNVLLRPGPRFLTWNPNMYDFENRIRDRSKDHLSVVERAQVGNIRGEGCPQPQLSLKARIAP